MLSDIQRTHSRSTTTQSLSSDVQFDAQANVKPSLHFTAQEIEMVRSSWKEMISDDLSKEGNQSSFASSLFCIQFYSNLMAMEPELEKMFPSIKHQAMSFSGVLSTAIINLDHLDKLDDYLNNLGKRHARILGIDPPHFELMGAAFLKTVQDRFGHSLTLAMERCWARLYTYLANSILQGGIDPILRVEKLNSDMYAVLERTSTQVTMNSSTTLFDQRSASTTSTSSLYNVNHSAQHQPQSRLASQSSYTMTGKPLPSQLRKASHSSSHNEYQTHAHSNLSQSRHTKRLSKSVKDDKDCTIM
ncbi:unnamed protein product [Cyberlindnera jadinii]|uniref:Globin-like protein n=1 Tax=Cyberlindnera jadinii (strain ATCC 18201 / CBS 1600 / BCRC 20928 / JCM 3617 / NBRC 0987 / NRRL Y-1542) TaxID=983966 RepID=A0A0H5C9N6_CYBJN|nr:globin-like protein [Cyberlindnera jadinii NRRL Y-1542]ODV73810.1 globin-like protein [Cyberlindnera jadinii NRRL Y-1542]CEP25146.1 unnamed protein product [Cyberlindnera jadinii]